MKKISIRVLSVIGLFLAAGTAYASTQVCVGRCLFSQNFAGHIRDENQILQVVSDTAEKANEELERVCRSVQGQSHLGSETKNDLLLSLKQARPGLALEMGEAENCFSMEDIDSATRLLGPAPKSEVTIRSILEQTSVYGM